MVFINIHKRFDDVVWTTSNLVYVTQNDVFLVYIYTSIIKLTDPKSFDQ